MYLISTDLTGLDKYRPNNVYFSYECRDIILNRYQYNQIEYNIDDKYITFVGNNFKPKETLIFDSTITGDHPQVIFKVYINGKLFGTHINTLEIENGVLTVKEKLEYYEEDFVKPIN